jgi:hypothetical protein
VLGFFNRHTTTARVLVAALALGPLAWASLGLPGALMAMAHYDVVGTAVCWAWYSPISARAGIGCSVRAAFINRK